MPFQWQACSRCFSGMAGLQRSNLGGSDLRARTARAIRAFTVLSTQQPRNRTETHYREADKYRLEPHSMDGCFTILCCPTGCKAHSRSEGIANYSPSAPSIIIQYDASNLAALAHACTITNKEPSACGIPGENKGCVVSSRHPE